MLHIGHTDEYIALTYKGIFKTLTIKSIGTLLKRINNVHLCSVESWTVKELDEKAAWVMIRKYQECTANLQTLFCVFFISLYFPHSNSNIEA